MEFLFRKILNPLFLRLGSAASGALIAVGATSEQVTAAMAALGTLAAIAFDLVMENRSKKKR